MPQEALMTEVTMQLLNAKHHLWDQLTKLSGLLPQTRIIDFQPIDQTIFVSSPWYPANHSGTDDVPRQKRACLCRYLVGRHFEPLWNESMPIDGAWKCLCLRPLPTPSTIMQSEKQWQQKSYGSGRRMELWIWLRGLQKFYQLTSACQFLNHSCISCSKFRFCSFQSPASLGRIYH